MLLGRRTCERAFDVDAACDYGAFAHVEKRQNEGTRAVTLEELEKEAASLPESDVATLRLPVPVLQGEGADVAAFWDMYWEPIEEPKTKALLRPGLMLAGSHLERDLSDEIRVLVRALGDAQTDYLLAVSAGDDDPTPRARFVLSELMEAIDFLLDDGVEDDRDAQLAALSAAHENIDSQDDLAAALDDFATLGKTLESELEALGTVDVKLIDEALELAAAVRTLSAPKGPKEQAVLLARRNRLAALLYTKMRRARRAASHVFRHHAEIRKLCTSTYERRRRAASRRAQMKREQSTNETPQA